MRLSTESRPAANSIAIEDPVDARSKPVLVWATLGAAILIFEAYVYARWAASGQATPTTVGRHQIPGYMAVAIDVWEVAMAAVLIGLLWFVVVRPYLRDRHLSTDALLLLALFTLFFQDLWVNWSATMATYNTGFWNFGSWYGLTPGWVSPNAHLIPEPILGVMPQYPALMFAFAVLGTKLLRWVKARRPRTTPIQLALVAFSVGFVADLILETLIFLPLGMWSYPGAIRWLTLFHGHYYQYPVYEGVLAGIFFGTFPVIRYFRNDQGETWGEWGSNALRTTPRKRSLVRFLGLVGLFNFVFLVSYNGPLQIFTLHSDSWPKDVLTRPYLTDGICGPGTTYACTGPRIPIPQGHSAHETPQGGLKP